ncbi:unnamed protein product, partial [Brenthis ino]
MDLLKTPSTQSLLDSDLESVESLQYVDFEELDEVEYALPASEAPTLAELLSSEELENENEHKLPIKIKTFEEPTICSALQVDFLQAVSQQLTQAQERSSAGAATTLSIGSNGRLTVGTAHGHLLSFYEQTLRWVCDAHGENGAVTCLSYNHDSTRLLAGFARGLVYQYESIRGIILRRVVLGGEIWGTLRVTWAGTSGLALDTGGSVWLIKFSRPLGVRSAKVSCLFSGARGEVVAMTARDARILALATLSRVIIVAGGKAAGVRLDGPPDVLPVLEWCEMDHRILVCARGNVMQWLTVTLNGSSINLRPVQRVELKATPIWLGWLGGSLAIFDSNENLRLWGDDYDKPLDLSQIEPVYSSAFFKGHWTDGRVSRAMCKAGESALGGACISEGTLALLGCRGVVRVKPRDLIARAQAFITSGRYIQALRLLCSAQGPDAKKMASEFIETLADRPHILSNKNVAVQVVKLCLKYEMSDELWSCLWENCSEEQAFVEALGDAAVRGELSNTPPSPDFTQALIEKLATFEPDLVERVVASLPLTSLDPHRASMFTREKGLWRGVGAIAAALDGCTGAMRELVSFVSPACAGAGGASCGCAGSALLLAAADALAGRGAGGRALPAHARPSARHDALHALLTEEGGRSPLRALVRHDAGAAARLLEQCARDPPFAGPLGKQNRLRVARALLACMPDLQPTGLLFLVLRFGTARRVFCDICRVSGIVVPPVSSLLAVDRCSEHPTSEAPRAAPRQWRSRVSTTRRSDGREVASSSGRGCGALEGATGALKRRQVTSDSYQVAWEKLDSMYNKKRFLANGILKRLLSQKSLLSESASEIKNLISTTSDCLESIKNIGVDVSSWDILIIHIISAKLDKDTRKAWELKVSSDPSDELPTFQQFSNFLIGRFRGLENIDSKGFIRSGVARFFYYEAMVQHLGLKRLAVQNTVVGVGRDKSVTSKFTVKINLRSRVDPRFQVKVNAHVLKSVTSLLPVAKATRVKWEDLTLGDLANPEYHTPNKIDILLGAEIYSQIIQEGIKRNLNGSLLAQDSAFGWIISGVCEVDSTSNIHSHTIVMHSYLEVDNMLKRFWELEAEPPVTKKMLTDDESKCEK